MVRLILQNSDKNTIVNVFNSFSKGLNASNLIRNPETAQLQMNIDSAYSMSSCVQKRSTDSLRNEIIHIIRKALSLDDLRISAFNLHMAFFEMTISLWQYSYLPVAAIWQAIDNKIS